MEQQKQLRSLSDEYQSLQNGMRICSIADEGVYIAAILMFGRYEQLGHSTSKARKPAAGKQGCAEGVLVETLSWNLEHNTEHYIGIQLAI
jgi:hypothetical protein